MMMHGCKKCKAITLGLILALGVLFLIKDLGIWNFWNINWWTALFLVIGITHIAKGKCKDCQAEMGKKK